MTEDIMPTFRQKIKLNNEELMFFHQDVNSWREKLREDGKKEPSTLEDLCYVLSSDDESERDTAENLVIEGNTCLRKGEWSRAISFYSSAISKKNTVARYYANRALGYLKRNSLAEAERDCTQAINLNPKYKKAYLRRACARKQLGKCIASCDDIEAVLKMEPDNNIALTEHKALIDYIQKDLLNNEKLKDDVPREEKTKLADKMKQEGNNLIAKGDYIGAKEKFTTAIKLNPKDPIYYANRAICHMKLVDFKTAETDCNKALELDMGYVKVYIRRARVRRKLGKMYDARQDLYNAYERSPGETATLDELEEVDNLIRKSEDNRRKNGMTVEEIGIFSLLESEKGGAGDRPQTVTLNWNELRSKNINSSEMENMTQEAESNQQNDANSKTMPTDNNTPISQTLQIDENQLETKNTKIPPQGFEDNRPSKNTSEVGTNTTADCSHNLREVFPLKRNDPAAKFSGPFIKVRVEDAKFALPEKLLEIPDELKYCSRDNGKWVIDSNK